MSSPGSAARPAGLAKPTDGLVSRLINRRLSTRITLMLLRLPRPPSPDAVTVLATVLVALGGLAFAAGLPWLGGLLAQAGSIVDGVDGELARALGRQSRAGALLDTVLDRLSDIALLAGMSLAVLASHGGLAAGAAALLAVTGDLMVSYLHGVGEKLAGRHPVLVGRIPGIAGRDVRLFIVFLAGLAGSPLAGLVAVAALGHCYVACKTVELLRYMEEQGL
ncbi:hypothetical protein CF15_07465 [Pyrodictium occultum]|uniref:CDP-alcohol phosphatidyltransferase n=1 Tax=Pyrodictium occultum TaxID=2309 RepID=A0A0V8RWZ5_PYROC|nr:CDP-alcohol phosphatidyltransferase family protein [Pyrodictium occultum]KSW12547.1 hypothetical protein CF15_07465 [Pyrodictium occultum]